MALVTDYNLASEKCQNSIDRLGGYERWRSWTKDECIECLMADLTACKSVNKEWRYSQPSEYCYKCILVDR